MISLTVESLDGTDKVELKDYGLLIDLMPHAEVSLQSKIQKRGLTLKT